MYNCTGTLNPLRIVHTHDVSVHMGTCIILLYNHTTTHTCIYNHVHYVLCTCTLYLEDYIHDCIEIFWVERWQDDAVITSLCQVDPALPIVTKILGRKLWSILQSITQT